MNYQLLFQTFNVENYIQKTFSSIKSQTTYFKKMEIIFIDDNSTDNTFNIINNISREYDNVKVFKSDENSGFAGRPRNIGIKNSNGKYLLFLDGDDELLVDSTKALMNNIISYNSDIVIGAYINRYENNSLEHYPPLSFGEELIFENTNDVDLLNIVPAISAKIFKRDFLKENNISFIEGIPGQDFVFLMKAILNSNKITVLNNHYVYFRNINNNSVSLKPDERYHMGLINAYLYVCNLFENHSIDLKIQEVIFKRHLSFFTTQILRTFYQNDSDNTIPHKVLHSEEFENLKNKAVFKNNNEYVKFFKYMDTGYYTDAKRLVSNMEFDLNITYNDLKNKINQLRDEKLKNESNLY